MSLPKLESSRNVTSKVMSNKAPYEIKIHRIWFKLFFRLDSSSTAHVTQWSNYLTQRAEILTRRSNLTPQLAKNTVNDLSVVSVVPPGENCRVPGPVIYVCRCALKNEVYNNSYILVLILILIILLFLFFSSSSSSSSSSSYYYYYYYYQGFVAERSNMWP